MGLTELRHQAASGMGRQISNYAHLKMRQTAAALASNRGPKRVGIQKKKKLPAQRRAQNARRWMAKQRMENPSGDSEIMQIKSPEQLELDRMSASYNSTNNTGGAKASHINGVIQGLNK